MLQRIVYYSSATQRVDAAELDRILGVSRRNNALHDVSGVLLFHEGSFFQVLEGPRMSVMRTFDRIQRDPRHVSVIRALAELGEERVFGEWSMGYAPIDQLEERQQAGYFDLRERMESETGVPGADAGGSVEILVRNFVHSLRGAAAG